MAIQRSGAFLSITVDSRKVENMINGLQKSIPEGVRISAKEVAGMYAGTYLEQMAIANITRWTGRSFNVFRRQIRSPERIGNGYGVLVPLNLIALDDLRQPHIVRLRPGLSITRWAKAKGFKGEYISVKRHPWINDANRRARRRVTQVVQREMDRKMREARR